MLTCSDSTSDSDGRREAIPQEAGGIAKLGSKGFADGHRRKRQPRHSGSGVCLLEIAV
jgi:hypothetical protein